MKKKLISIIMPLVLLFSTLGTPVMAQALNNSDDTVTTTSANDDAPKADDSAGRAARIAKYKQKLSTNPSEANKLRVAARCVAAQGLLKVRVTSNGAATKARKTAYSSIIKDLQDITKTAEAKGVSVQAINADIPVLQAKIDAFNTANDAYQQDLNDLAEIDCKTDPTGFQAALQTARTDQLAVYTAATSVRSYINDNIKPVLKALKAELVAQAASKEDK